MAIARKLRTFAFMLRRRPQQAWELLQIRAERRFGVPLYFLSLRRLSTYVFEVLTTKARANGNLTAYGNYYLDASRIPDRPVIFSLGIGQDITFDAAVLARHSRVELFMFDPTPTSKSFIEGQDLPPNAHFEALAVTDHDGDVELFSDDLTSDIATTSSVSVYNRGFEQKSFRAPCRRFSTLMRERGIETVDVLKMDIEGAGVRVLNDILAEGCLPAQIACEFERPGSLAQTAQFLRDVANLFETLRSRGYEIYRTRDLDRGCQIEIVAVANSTKTPAARAVHAERGREAIHDAR